MGRKPKHQPSFFKILIGDFANKLRVPPAFVAKCKGKLPKKAVIVRRSENGESYSWAVKIEQIGDDCEEEEEYWFMHKGWQNCVKDNQLIHGDFLIFRLISDFVFEIVTYSRNGCEKKHQQQQLQLLKVEPQDSDSEQNKEFPFTARRNTRSRKPKDSPSNRSFEPRRSPRSSQEVLVEEVGSAQPAHPSFSVVLKQHHRCCVSLPKPFAIETGLTWKKRVVLRNEEGKVWIADLKVRPSYDKIVSVGSSITSARVDMTCGWSNFRVANRIEYGSTCVFKYIPSAGDVIHVEVLKKPSSRSK